MGNEELIKLFTKITDVINASSIRFSDCKDSLLEFIHVNPGDVKLIDLDNLQKHDFMRDFV